MEDSMAQKKKVIATVVDQKQLAPGIFDMWLKTELAQDAKCGQFIGVYPEDKSNLLFTDEDEKDDFFDEIEELEEKLEDLEDELDDLTDELEDMEEENIENDTLKESIKNITNRAQEISQKIGKSVNNAMKDLGNYMKDLGKSINSYKDCTFKNNSKANKLLNVLPFLDEADIHELVQDLLNNEECFANS